MNVKPGSGHERESAPPMTARRSAAAAAVLAATMLAASAAAQGQPSLDDVLGRAAAYVDEFRRQLSGIAAEETYEQHVRTQRGVTAFGVRTLKSDLLLLRPAGGGAYVEYRDVFEVDGKEVRDRQERLTTLLQAPSAAGLEQIGRIVRESARYNIGRVYRTVNTPVLPLMFLDDTYRSRFRFKRTRKAAARADLVAPDFSRAPSEPEDVTTPAVFRVSTEMWTIEYRERDRPTIIKRPTGGNLPARGRFWINPDTGAVLMSELITEGGDVTATITVSYQSEPLMGFLVPVEMRERYVGFGDLIDGRAVYGRFRVVDRQ
jgi:hypothetical protein